MDFKQKEDGFELYFNNQLIIKHDETNPCFKLGKGTARFKLKGHKFKIQEKLLEEFSLKHHELISFSNKGDSLSRLELSFSNANTKLTVEIEEKGNFLEIIPHYSDSSINRFWFFLNACPEEAIFGCGARFEKINLRGSIIHSWVEDCSPVFRDYYTYFPLPTFISSSNYFCHVDTCKYSEFNFEAPDYHVIHVWGIPKKIIICKQDNLISLIKELSNYFGRQPPLPDWVHDGIILGIQGGTQVVEEKIKIAEKAGIKICAVWCQDWQGIRMTSFGQQLFWNWKHDDTRYPNLPIFIKELNARGIKFLGYINTQLSTEGDLYKEGADKNYFLKNDNGEDYIIYTTDFPVAVLDLSNPNTLTWIKEIIKKHMLGIGLAGWMADYGEYVPVDAVNHARKEGECFHNEYPVIFAKIMHDLLKEEGKLDEIFYFHRSGYIHSSKYMMCYWPGDQLVDWDDKLGIGSVISCGISLGLCGIGNYHFDLGGFTTYGPYKRSKELFMRWAELSAFSLIMRTHEGNRPKDNWQFDGDSETLEHLSKMVKIHVHLKPYLLECEKEYQLTGIPPMRPLFLHYPKDSILHDLNFQYLLGRDLLIAPVIQPKKNQWNCYLPDDSWIHAWSGKRFKKGWYVVEAPLGRPPVFYRETSHHVGLFNELKNF